MHRVRIAFVEPRGAPSNVFAKFMSIPLLGPVYLATIAAEAGYDAIILNENILGREILASELSEIDILCLSCLTATIGRGQEIARQYRSIRRSGHGPSRVIVGGIHASMLPGEVAATADQVVVGEAEAVLLDVLSGKITDPVVRGRPVPDLDRLPIPDFSLVQGWKDTEFVPVMTSRGCPFHCNFCSVTEMFGRNYRMQSPARVMREILRYRKGFLFFVDDHFTANLRRTEMLLDMMIAQGFDRPWGAQVRTEVTRNEALVRAMRRAGCTTVYVGFESINPQSLKTMNKSQSVGDIERTIRVFHDNGILVHGMFMLGNDPDTPDVTRATSEFVLRNRIDFAQYSILTPLPGTELHRRIEAQGRLLHRRWEFYDGLHAVFNPLNMSAHELQRGMVNCFSEFYSYRNAVYDAVSRTLAAAGSTAKRLYCTSYLPSFFPVVMKIAGRRIITEWLEQNRPYLAYLSGLNTTS